MKKLLAFLAASTVSVSVFAQGEIRITEYLYSGNGDEYIEFTNVGDQPLDMTGWSFDDDSQTAGTVDLSAFGTVAPGESVILTEGDPLTFAADWSLTGVKIIGFLSANLGRNDEVNLYDASMVLADRLTYGDEVFPGTIRAKDASGWTFASNLGANNIYFWVLAEVGDAQGSVMSVSGDLGNPGVFSAAAPTISFGRLNEIFVSHAGTDNQEFIEIYGIPAGPLTNVMVLVVEGDSTNAGTLDRAFDLTGNSIPSGDNYFVLGNTAVTNLDLDIGASNIIENGTETIYLIEANDPMAVAALVGTNITTGADTTLIATLGNILDVIAIVDGGILDGTDVVFDGAATIGPDGASFLPAGIYRGGNFPADWCDGYLDFDNVVNLLQPTTPGAANGACYIDDFGQGCAGAGGFTPRLQIRGDLTPGGAMDLSIYDGEGGAPFVLFLSFLKTEVAASPSCNLLVGPAPLIVAINTVLPGAAPGDGDRTFNFVLPASTLAGTFFLQAFVGDSTVPQGFVVTNGTGMTITN